MPGPLHNEEAQVTMGDVSDHQPVVLNTQQMGNECVIVKNGRRICGRGSALAKHEIVQDKSYYEMRIQSGGAWAVGVATKQVDLNAVPLGKDAYSWVLRSDGSLAHDDATIDKVTFECNEGDHVGVSFDHIELNFFVNGKNLHCPITGIRGSLYPIVCVDDGCIIDMNFDNFMFPPPPGFQKLIPEKSLL